MSSPGSAQRALDAVRARLVGTCHESAAWIDAHLIAPINSDLAALRAEVERLNGERDRLEGACSDAAEVRAQLAHAKANPGVAGDWIAQEAIDDSVILNARLKEKSTHLIEVIAQRDRLFEELGVASRDRDAARAELAAVRETLGAAHHALRNVDECWSFGGRQEPTHTWHTREDWRERHRETLEKAHDPQAR